MSLYNININQININNKKIILNYLFHITLNWNKFTFNIFQLAIKLIRKFITHIDNKENVRWLVYNIMHGQQIHFHFLDFALKIATKDTTIYVYYMSFNIQMFSFFISRLGVIVLAEIEIY